MFNFLSKLFTNEKYDRELVKNKLQEIKDDNIVANVSIDRKFEKIMLRFQKKLLKNNYSRIEVMEMHYGNISCYTNKDTANFGTLEKAVYEELNNLGLNPVIEEDSYSSLPAAGGRIVMVVYVP